MEYEMTLEEMIFELNDIDRLYEQKNTLHREIKHIDSEKEQEEESLGKDVIATLHEFREKEDLKFDVKKPCIAAACLVTPPAPPKKPKTTDPAKDLALGVLSGLLVFVCVAFWLITVLIPPLGDLLGMLNVLVSIAMIGAIVYWFAVGSHKVTMFVDWQNATKEWKEKQAEWERKFNTDATEEENARFLSEFKAYDAGFLKLVDVCSKKYDTELQRYKDGLEEIKEKYQKKADSLSNKLSDVEKELDEVTFIDHDLFHVAWRMASILKTGRADNLKEAINLALDDERKDNEEAARQAEARQQEAILEQQAYDNRMHNEAMQRAAEAEARAVREHNEAMERAARAQAREAEKQTQMAQRQAREAATAAAARCRWCANAAKCPSVVKNNAATCSAYRPR